MLMNPVVLLLAALAALSVFFTSYWARAVHGAREWQMPTAVQTGIGAVTNFFDTLGIGSFAPTTALWRAAKTVPDRIIPGTLNVGHTIPVIAQAFIFTAIIPVDAVTLFSMIGAAVVGAWFGAGIVARLPRRQVQIGMGLALLAAALLMLMTQFELIPGGGAALGVDGWRLGVAVGANLVLGALMTLGIGMYAPSLILISLLGMSPRAAFPIMMGSCAFLQPVGSMRFVRERSYSVRAALGLTLGGLPAVLIAAYLVKELPLGAIRWLVIIAVVYTAASMLWSAFKDKGSEDVERSAVPAVAGPPV